MWLQLFLFLYKISIPKTVGQSTGKLKLIKFLNQLFIFTAFCVSCRCKIVCQRQWGTNNIYSCYNIIFHPLDNSLSPRWQTFGQKQTLSIKRQWEGCYLYNHILAISLSQGGAKWSLWISQDADSTLAFSLDI